MQKVIEVMKETVQYVVATLIHNAPILILGILVAAAIRVYVDPEKMRQKLMNRSTTSIGASVLFGTFTPFCACGTMAVIVAMMTTALPWAPVMAFLTSSPLMSPDAFILYSGIVSVKFATALTGASIVVGLGSGYLTYLIEKKTDFLKGQARFGDLKVSQSACLSTGCSPKHQPKAEIKVHTQTICEPLPVSTCGCKSSATTALASTPAAVNPAETSKLAPILISTPDLAPAPTENRNFVQKYRIKELVTVFYKVGVKQVLVYFSVFAAIGFLINKFVPASLIMQYMGNGNSFAVPLMALIGLPLYVSGSSAIPIVNALIAGGASHGALLAFMITGPGTSAGVIAGLVTIMKKKAIALYMVYLLVFAVALGYLYDYLLLLGL